jgi:hypothetical protein
MASIELHRDFTVRRPVAEVFDLLADLETYLPQWAKGPVAVRKTTPGPKRTGTRLTVTARVGPVKVRSPYEITAWKPHEVFGGSGTARARSCSTRNTAWRRTPMAIPRSATPSPLSRAGSSG